MIQNIENLIEIDSLTDCLINRITGEKVDTEYSLINKTITIDYAQKLIADGWKFDWSLPQKNGYQVYKLAISGTDELQGLIALKHIPDQLFTQIDIVESNPKNIGKSGKYEGVGGNLFAIACKESWDAGNEGYVRFVSKSDLVDHYIKMLNAKLIDSRTLYIDSYGALNLIHKYFREE